MCWSAPPSPLYSANRGGLRKRLGSPSGVSGKVPANAGHIRDVDLILGLGRPPGGGYGNPLQCSCLENPTDRGAWRATVHSVSWCCTQLKHSMHAHNEGSDLHHHQAPVRPPQVWCQRRPCGDGDSHLFPAVIKASSPLVRCPQRQIEEPSPGRNEAVLLSHLHRCSSARENHLKRKVSVRSRVSAEYNNAQVSIKICSS